MRTYKATVRVTKSGGIGYMHVWGRRSLHKTRLQPS